MSTTPSSAVCKCIWWTFSKISVSPKVIHLNRPLRCQACCFPCCLQELEVIIVINNGDVIVIVVLFFLLNCGFSSNWILLYFPLFVRPCVTGMTSHISHIYKGINAMLIIRGPIKPYTFCIKIILAISLAKTRPESAVFTLSCFDYFSQISGLWFYHSLSVSETTTSESKIIKSFSILIFLPGVPVPEICWEGEDKWNYVAKFLCQHSRLSWDALSCFWAVHRFACSYKKYPKAS